MTEWAKGPHDFHGEPLIVAVGDATSEKESEQFVGLDFVAFVVNPLESDSDPSEVGLEIQPGGLFVGCGINGAAVAVEAATPSDFRDGMTLTDLWDGYEPGGS